MVTIEEYCPVPSPTLRCGEARSKGEEVLVCVKYKGHKTPCHFEVFPGGRVKNDDHDGDRRGR